MAEAKGVVNACVSCCYYCVICEANLEAGQIISRKL